MNVFELYTNAPAYESIALIQNGFSLWQMKTSCRVSVLLNVFIDFSDIAASPHWCTNNSDNDNILVCLFNNFFFKSDLIYWSIPPQTKKLTWHLACWYKSSILAATWEESNQEMKTNNCLFICQSDALYSTSLNLCHLCFWLKNSLFHFTEQHVCLVFLNQN